MSSNLIARSSLAPVSADRGFFAPLRCALLLSAEKPRRAPERTVVIVANE
ncbi:MAG: hypothetical protein ACUVSX_09240 [Aggregatilineales bacterium]